MSGCPPGKSGGVATCGGWSIAQARSLRIELPSWHEELHLRGVVARPEAVLLVEPMRFLDLGQVDLDAEPRTIRHHHRPARDPERLLRQPLPVLPDPVRVDGGDPS